MRPLLLLLVPILLLSALADSSERDSILTAGVASVNITPPVGIAMGGWAARDKPSQAVADDLYAKALVFSDGNTTAAILTMDVLKTYPDIVDSIRQHVVRRCGIPPDHVLIGASHTHFSPIIDLNGTGPYERAYAQTLIGKCAGAVEMAFHTQQPVWIGAAMGTAPDVTFNRRVTRANGTVFNSWRYPADTTGLSFGPVDPDVGVLGIETLSGTLLASMIHYATHPVCGMNEMYALSADYPAYAVQVIEQIEGGICLFGLGPCGNQVPIEREGNSRVEIGRAIGGEALKVLQRMPVYHGVPVGVESRILTFATKPNKFVKRDSVDLEVQVIAVGDIVFVALPGEVVTELGLDLKRRSGLEHLFIIELANGGDVGYVLRRQDYTGGGYEALNGALQAGSGERLVDTALELIESLDWCIGAEKVPKPKIGDSGFGDFSQKGYDITKEQLKGKN
jgi:hypothetical protein